ncbi:UDP-glycosyltransferase 92A1-like [Wolffia australiana]
MARAGEVLVLPFHDKGHVFPATELSRHLALRGLSVTLFLPSPPPSPLPHNVSVLLFSDPKPPPPPPPTAAARPFPKPRPRRDAAVEEYLARRRGAEPPLLCVILDEIVRGYADLFESHGLRVVSFFTSSACAAVKEDAAPALGPLRGLAGARGAVAAALFNTCADLERPYLAHAAAASGKPVWGVGPLLRSEAEVDDAVRSWLDAKPAGSVVYVSFGTLVAPAAGELEELAAALEGAGRPFVWALVGRGFAPEKTSELGLVIRGWAPQQMILGHPSTAAFVSHCGWNSTTEALAAGVPVLAWPVRGDQHFNAELLTERLGVGRLVRADGSGLPVGRGELARAIEELVSDQAVKARAAAARSFFDAGFPSSSARALDEFVDFLLSPHRPDLLT